MFLKSAVKVSLAVLFITGCGGPAEPESSEALGSTEQSVLYACDGSKAWTRYWYSDSKKTKEVGREDCDCSGTVTPHGTLSGYYSQVLSPACF